MSKYIRFGKIHKYLSELIYSSINICIYIRISEYNNKNGLETKFRKHTIFLLDDKFTWITSSLNSNQADSLQWGNFLD